MKKYIGISILAVLIFSACKKEQKKVDDLEGLWTVTSYTENGDSTGFGIFASDTAPEFKGALSYQFRGCNVKGKDTLPCSGFISGTFRDSTSGSASSLMYFFNFNTDGKKSLDLDVFFDSTATTINATIDKLDKKELDISFDNGGVSTVIKLERANV